MSKTQQKTTDLKNWSLLQQHAEQISGLHMKDLFAQDPDRFTRFSTSGAGFTLDYSKNRITEETLGLLVELAKEVDLPGKIEAMFSGDQINNTEKRPVLHTALRNFSERKVVVDGSDIMAEIKATLAKMAHFVWKIHSGQWRGFGNDAFTDVISIGIGGSYLGFLIQSKSFGTQETLENTKAAREWFLNNGGTQDTIARHFVAITSNIRAATEFGMDKNNLFPMWDWVGGRYSLWSAIGLPVALATGMENFRRILRGAYEMDEHFRHTPLTENIPVLLGLLGVWYTNFMHADSYAILPYDHYLRALPAHLQQLDMESNGKQVTRDGEPVGYETGPIIWGGAGANGQHAYHQLIHQGTRLIPVDFIIPLHSHNPIAEHHSILFANCLSQSQAMMQGKTLEQAKQELLDQGVSESEAAELAPHKVIPGNKPNNMLVFDKATPEAVGALIAMYEHKVFVQGAIWNLNSFDQWGVELGKQLGKQILPGLQDKNSDLSDFDCSTKGLISLFRERENRL
ncbi:MAG: glucose-6-phosphate isomerase [Gammaproteobacteria bacterium]|nr:MAG: glucose-6-phosphate isomerase [Gammaproteobacteria bacterium]